MVYFLRVNWLLDSTVYKSLHRFNDRAELFVKVEAAAFIETSFLNKNEKFHVDMTLYSCYFFICTLVSKKIIEIVIQLVGAYSFYSYGYYSLKYC